MRLASLIAALALLPLTPLVASVVYRLTFKDDRPISPGYEAYLNWHTVIATVLLVAFAVALIPAGLILMRRPDASGAWALGILTITLGVIGTAYAATTLVLAWPGVSPLALAWPGVSPDRVLLLVVLSTVPATVGFRLMRQPGLTSVQALGLLAFTLSVIGVIYLVTRLSHLFTSEVEPSGQVVASIAQAVALSIAPLVAGTLLLRRKGVSAVRSLGIIVILLGIIGATNGAVDLAFYFEYSQSWHVPAVVDFAMVSCVVVVSALAGFLMIQEREMSIVSALGIFSIALGVIGLSFMGSATIAILLLIPPHFLSYPLLYVSSIVASLLLYVPLIIALSVVPVSAGVILMRKTHASRVWALGLMAIVFAVVGTTFSAAQLLATGAPSYYLTNFSQLLLDSSLLP